MESIYIKASTEYNINQPIPGSILTDSVTIQIRRNSDGYYWDFDNSEWSATTKSGTMTFDYSIFWKASFTPATLNDAHNVVITFGTIVYTQVLITSTQASQYETESVSDLTTLANVKAWTKEPGTGLDALISDLITRVSKYIKVYCERDILSKDYTEYHNGHGSNYLLLNQYPITAITSIHDDLDRNFDASTLIDSDDIIFTTGTNEALAGIVYLDGFSFSCGKNNIKVIYTAGYASVPADLEQACIRMVIAEMRDGTEGQMIRLSGNGEEFLPINLRREAMKVLDRYKKVR
jgi:hypothetical protein